MAIQQNKKQSDLEKRLQLLRRQVYGRSDQSSFPSGTHGYQLSDNKQNQSDDRPASPIQPASTLGGRGERPMTKNYSVSDLTYLHQDLLKILIFASCVIGAQVILFLLVENNVFTLVFR